MPQLRKSFGNFSIEIVFRSGSQCSVLTIGGESGGSSIGLRPTGGSGLSSLLLSSEPQLGLHSSHDLWVDWLDRDREMGSGWVVASLISVPVNNVLLTVGTDVGVAAPHHHHVSPVDVPQRPLGLLLDV